MLLSVEQGHTPRNGICIVTAIEPGADKGTLFWLLDACQMVHPPKIPIMSSYMYYSSLLPINFVCLCSFSAEEVDICELLHLVNITTQSDLFVVEQNPT